MECEGYRRASLCEPTYVNTLNSLCLWTVPTTCALSGPPIVLSLLPREPRTHPAPRVISSHLVREAASGEKPDVGRLPVAAARHVVERAVVLGVQRAHGGVRGDAGISRRA